MATDRAMRERALIDCTSMWDDYDAARGAVRARK